MAMSASRRPLLARSASDRIVSGVAGGIAARLGVDAAVVRFAFVVLSVAGGAGVVAYLLAWLASTPPVAETSSSAAPSGSVRRVVALGISVAGVMLLLREAGVWFDDALAWSAGLAAFGSAIAWTRSDDRERSRLARLAAGFPRQPAEALSGSTRHRLAAGTALVVAGMATVLASETSLGALRNVVVAVTVTVAGIVLILGPWIVALGRQLAEERRERIRSEERTEVAAHLHDSVLQTLALIQRSSSPMEMTALARRQERELRSWLYGRTRPRDGVRTLSTAVDALATRIEQMHGVTVETVVVGDGALDARLRALLDAAGEAANNAAKHSQAPRISVYAEILPDAAAVYVRDEGAGFDAEAPPARGHGIAESILGRMERNGGTAAIRSRMGEGTEIELRMPRRSP